MIGVVGPDRDAARLADAVTAAEVVTGGAAAVLEADPNLVAAIGDAALGALVRAGVGVPILAVEASDGLDSVTATDAPGVIDRAVRSPLDTRPRPVLEVAVDGTPAGRGLFDAMLVTSEPARISEYAVETPGGTRQFRADGVVVATPAGSHGYARAVGGPVLDHDAGCLAVAPVAEFAIRASSRVVGVDATIAVSVERDEGDVSLLVDGDVLREVPTRRPVTVRAADVVETLVPPGE